MLRLGLATRYSGEHGKGSWVFRVHDLVVKSKQRLGGPEHNR